MLKYCGLNLFKCRLHKLLILHGEIPDFLHTSAKVLQLNCCKELNWYCMLSWN